MLRVLFAYITRVLRVCYAYSWRILRVFFAYVARMRSQDYELAYSYPPQTHPERRCQFIFTWVCWVAEYLASLSSSINFFADTHSWSVFSCFSLIFAISWENASFSRFNSAIFMVFCWLNRSKSTSCPWSSSSQAICALSFIWISEIARVLSSFRRRYCSSHWWFTRSN